MAVFPTSVYVGDFFGGPFVFQGIAEGAVGIECITQIPEVCLADPGAFKCCVDIHK